MGIHLCSKHGGFFSVKMDVRRRAEIFIDKDFLHVSEMCVKMCKMVYVFLPGHFFCRSVSPRKKKKKKGKNDC